MNTENEQMADRFTELARMAEDCKSRGVEFADEQPDLFREYRELTSTLIADFQQ